MQCNLKHSLSSHLRLLYIAVLFSSTALGQSTSSFPALQGWKTTIVQGNIDVLNQLYSNDPPARVTVLGKTSTEVSPAEDAKFWVGLKARRISLNVSQSAAPQPGLQQVTFQATVRTAPPGRTLYVLEAQLWQHQTAGWRLVAVQRTDTFKLEQPLSLNAKIYPAASGARADIKNALTSAAKTRKRVLVIFGADWCYDCHVLDRALLRSDIAPILNANYMVVHVDVGQGDKNQDLMNQYQVPMSRGVPAMAVLDSKGTLLYSQKNGEFERARALGPEDLLEFLNEWKPQTR
jgi:hypothetical protein